MKSPRFSLSFIILSSLASLLLLTWLLLSIISIRTTEQLLYSQKAETARVLLDSYIAVLAAGHSEGAALMARRLSSEKDFAGLQTIGADGTIIYSAGKSVLQGQILDRVLKGEEVVATTSPGKITRFSPVSRNGNIEAAAALTVSLVPEQERLRSARKTFMSYFAIDFVLLLGLGSLLLSRTIVSPIRRLASATNRITHGDLTLRVQVAGSREIGELSDSFNTMAESLRHKNDELQRNLKSLEESNRNLQEARNEAMISERLASVGILAAGMAHEIGTPLAAVMGYAEMLRQEMADNAEASDFIKHMIDACGKIDRTVRELLSYARPKPPTIEKLDFHTFLADTFRMLNAQGVFRKISFSFNIQPDMSPLLTDGHQLQQVITNLAINARDSMPEGGEFRVLVFQEEDMVVIRVRDTGTGIPEDKLDRIFDPFYTTKDPGKGTGLGLSISARIIDSFGGTITAANGNPGAVFTIRIPLPAGQKGISA